MEARTEPVVVYSGPLVQAQRAFSALEGHGVRAELQDQNVALGYGFFPARVVVRPQDLENARVVLEESGLIPRR